ncbi:MAG: hypothetical protein ABIJ18_01600 [archaeon]
MVSKTLNYIGNLVGAQDWIERILEGDLNLDDEVYEDDFYGKDADTIMNWFKEGEKERFWAEDVYQFHNKEYLAANQEPLAENPEPKHPAKYEPISVYSENKAKQVLNRMITRFYRMN